VFGVAKLTITELLIKTQNIMASKKYEEKYTKPELREEIKEDLKKSSKGGKKGQWSARKSQMLVQEYEKQGGGYKGKKNKKAAKSLAKWSDENWQTKSGKTKARDKGSVHRYLPEEVWDNLSKKEQQKAERKKEKASEKGEQYVAWTPAIKREMQKLGYASGNGEQKSKQELYEEAQKLNIKGRSKMKKKELSKAIKNKKDDQTKMQSKSNSKRKSISVNQSDLMKRAKKLGIDDRKDLSQNKLQKAVQKEDQKQLQNKKKAKLVKMADKLGVSDAKNMKKKKLAKNIAKAHVGKKVA
jgi:hypothetical protein